MEKHGNSLRQWVWGLPFAIVGGVLLSSLLRTFDWITGVVVLVFLLGLFVRAILGVITFIIESLSCRRFDDFPD